MTVERYIVEWSTGANRPEITSSRCRSPNGGGCASEYPRIVLEKL